MFIASFTFKTSLHAQDEPPLPMGLEEETSSESKEPELPQGLEKSLKTEKSDEEELLGHFPFEFSGFLEGRLGSRTQEDPHEKDISIGETRFHLQVEKAWERAAFRLTTDFLYDPVPNRYDVRLEEGEGFLDLREARLALRATDFMDLKIGRQILTWGTGDLIFINDLFPKDWNAFFIGRNVEYLKAPSDALKVSLFHSLMNVDIVYIPCFDTDRFIDGRRISFFNSSLGRRTGRDRIVHTEKPDNWFSDDEIAWRFYSNLAGYELSLYGYYGFWKSPAGQNPVSGKASFPILAVYGLSLRGTFVKGIGNIEMGYYDSEEDRSGNNPFVRNSEFRFLIGYEKEAATDFTLGIQYYLEHMMEHRNYLKALPTGNPQADKNRHVVMVRLTKLLMSQNLKLSLFSYYSPSDSDAYLRPNIHFKIDDHWSAEIGGNVFTGKKDHTFFAQFEKNSNIYTGLRYGF